MRKLLVSASLVILSLSGAAFGANAADPFASVDQHTLGLTRVTGPTYVNPTYGYAIRLPDGQAGWTDTPPSPIHGIDLYLGPHRSIEVEAAFDSALLGSTAALADDVATQFPGAATTQQSKDLLGHKAAIRTEQAWPAIARRRVALVAWVSQGTPGDAINYVVTLETTDHAYEQDKRVFTRLIESFHFVARHP